MIAAIVVGGTVVLAVAFTAAWLARPGLRARIERPKHAFQSTVRTYDARRRRDETRGPQA
jgi:hypothetical protein